MFRRLYDRTIALAAHRRASWALGGVAFLESSVFPIPPDVLMIPMIVARPRRAFLYAAIATLASILGALLGYYIGATLFDSVGLPLLELYGKAESFDDFAQRYNDWGPWVVLMAGVTPFPFKVITIASGATGLSFPVFVLAALIARASRFFLVAALLWYFGEPIRDFIERRLGLVMAILLVLFFGGFFLVRYL